MLFLNAEPDWTPEATAHAERLIEGFYRAGGRPTVKDWREAHAVEREIMVRVRRRLDLEAMALESGDDTIAAMWANTLAPDERERIAADLLSIQAARERGRAGK